jgi:triacylglycerol lipase
MKIGSALLKDLNRDQALLAPLDCHSLFTPTDITVFPGWRAVLPLGSRRALPVLTHRQLIIDPRAVRAVADVLLAP